MVLGIDCCHPRILHRDDQLAAEHAMVLASAVSVSTSMTFSQHHQQQCCARDLIMVLD